MDTFDPNKPLPAHILEQFIQETKEQEEPEEITLPSNFVIRDAQQALKRKKKTALELLESKRNRGDLERVSYSNSIASRTKLPVAPQNFAQNQPKKLPKAESK